MSSKHDSDSYGNYCLQMSVADTVDSLRARVSTPVVKRVLQKLGIFEGTQQLYWTVLLFFNGSKTTRNIGKYTETFRTPTWRVLAQVRSAFGEETIIEILLSDIREDDIVYDIGANVGLYSTFVAGQLSAGTVVAFEPHLANFRLLRQNTERYGDRIQLHQVGLSNENRKIEFDDKCAVNETFSVADGVAGGEYEAEFYYAADFLERNSIPSPNVVKIDVEGEEIAVIDSLGEVLSEETCRIVYCEVHDPEAVGSVSERLSSFGFSVTKLAERKNEIFLRARK